MRLETGTTYKHVKTDKEYKLICLAKDVHTLEDFVVLEALYENAVGLTWIRSKENFLGEAKSPDGSFHPRFEKA